MNNRISLFLFGALLFAASFAQSQNVRADPPLTTISSSYGPLLQANVPPNAPILAVCHSPANAVPCTNYATTFTYSGTACPNGAQDTPQPAYTSSCQPSGDSQGNIGFWAPAGQYDYTVCIQNNCLGPFTITLGGSGGGSGGLPNGATPVVCSSATTVVNLCSVALPTAYNTPNLVTTCWDNGSPIAHGIYPYDTEINTTTFQLTYLFSYPALGYCVVNGSGGGGSGGDILLLNNVFSGANTFAETNGVLNPASCGTSTPPTWCSGSDLGAWINSAVAVLPTVALTTINSGSVAYPSGTIEIPNSGGIQTFNTMIGTGVLLSLVTLRCDPGTTLQYSGTGTDWIDALDPNGLNDTASGGIGGIAGCTFIAKGSPTANQRIIHYGNVAIGYKIANDYFQGMTSTGDSAVYIENTNYFTEELDLTGSQFHQNLAGVVLSKNCGSAPNCTNSFQHSRLNFYCQTAFSVVSYCLEVLNGASSFKDLLLLDFNIVGASNSAAIYVDSTSTFGYNVGDLTGENQTGGNGYVLTGAGVTAGGAFTNGLHVYCGVCNSPIAAIDIPFGFLDTFGSYSSSTVIGSYAASLDQQAWFNSISCRNVTGGSCTTAPTIAVSGGTISQTVVCPTTVSNVTTSGSIGSPQALNPGNAATISVSSAGASCTAPKFSVVLQMWGW